jgi:hypothetical protein
MGLYIVKFLKEEIKVSKKPNIRTLEYIFTLHYTPKIKRDFDVEVNKELYIFSIRDSETKELLKQESYKIVEVLDSNDDSSLLQKQLNSTKVSEIHTIPNNWVLTVKDKGFIFTDKPSDSAIKECISFILKDLLTDVKAVNFKDNTVICLDDKSEEIDSFNVTLNNYPVIDNTRVIKSHAFDLKNLGGGFGS